MKRRDDGLGRLSLGMMNMLDHMVPRRGRRSGRIAPGAGMTLVEVMVALGIIAVVAVMCTSAFMTVLGSEMRETNTRLASEEVEERIAVGAPPVATPEALDLPIGDYTMPSEVRSYEETVGTDAALATENGQIDVSGSRSYSVLEGKEPDPPERVPTLFFGDYAEGTNSFSKKSPTSGECDGVITLSGISTSIPTDVGKGDIMTEIKKNEKYQAKYQATMPESEEIKVAIDTGNKGGSGIYTAPEPGHYRLEVWGAGSSTVSGGYSYGVIKLEKGTSLYLYVGGASTGNNGGYNGGGYGSSSGGAGATDIRMEKKPPGYDPLPSGVSLSGDTSLYTRVIVAGGGGAVGKGGGKDGGAGVSQAPFDYGTQVSPSDRFGGSNPNKTPTGKGTDKSKGGGGGWYGGVPGLYGGGGSGWVFTDGDESEEGTYPYWKNKAAAQINSSSPAALALDAFYPEYCLTGEQTKGVPSTIRGGVYTVDDKGNSIAYSNKGGGFIRITYLPDYLPL